MNVYRVEHETKKCKTHYAGPYGVSNVVLNSSQWTEREHLHQNGHPGPSADIPNLPNSFEEYRCGFNSLAQLNLWFNSSELQKLNQLGFIVAIYQSEDPLIGSRQVLFIPQGTRKLLTETAAKQK